MRQTRTCSCCHRELPMEDFYRRFDQKGPNARRSRCRWCFMAGKDKAKKLYTALKSRCKIDGVEFNLTPEDMASPDVCPVLGIPLSHGWNGRERGYRDSSPSVDRLDGARGYVKGNVVVVSHRANRLRSDGTLDELRKILAFYERILPCKAPMESSQNTGLSSRGSK